MEAYQAIAIRLASHAEELAGLRERLETGKMDGPLYNTARLTRHMELAYLRMYADYRAGIKPRGFSVQPISG